MGFLGSLGVDWNLLLAQVINFGLLVIILNRFLYRPIIKRLEKENQAFDKVKELQGQLEKEREEFENHKRQQEADLNLKSKRIIEEAEEIAEEIKHRASTEANEEKQKIIAQIKTKLEDIEHLETQQ